MRHNELFFYDSQSNSWTSCDQKGKGPMPRSYHTAWFDGNPISPPYFYRYSLLRVWRQTIGEGLAFGCTLFQPRDLSLEKVLFDGESHSQVVACHDSIGAGVGFALRRVLFF